MESDKKINRFAAKSCRENRYKWSSFVTHSLDTALVMSRLFDNWLPQHDREYMAVQLGTAASLDEGISTARRVCRLISLLHDLGKLTPVFQCRISENIEGYRDMLYSEGIGLDAHHDAKATPHAAAGAAILEDIGFPHGLAAIIASHHGKSEAWDEQIKNNEENFFGHDCEQEELWKTVWTSWVGYCLEECGFDRPEAVPEPNVKLQMLMTALLIMSDWIASNTYYFPLTDCFGTPENTLERASAAFGILGLPPCWEADRGYADNEDMFTERFGFEPNDVQSQVMDIVSEAGSAGVYILEAPMGLGKTEAALAAAEILAEKFGCGGLYFGLPTQATANGIFGRIHSWAAHQTNGEKHTIRLAHGMTELNEEYQQIFRGCANDVSDDSELFVHDWFEGRKQALLADFVIATVDQFLLASLKQKHVMLRHLGLSGKVVIIDECHAYDAYMNTYLDKTLTWMGAYNVPVIILSATLPQQRRQELLRAYLNTKKDIAQDIPANAYPVLTWTDSGMVNSRVLSDEHTKKRVSVSRLSESELADAMKKKLSDGGCAAVIVNTVDHAQKLSRSLADRLNGFEVICFHSRFSATDRADIEKTLLARTGASSQPAERDRLIVVGTQVIEQSLDLDFDFMVTELCPMDLILQRSGRLHRHRRSRPCGLEQAELAVLSEHSSGTEKIYSKWLLRQTEKYLPDELAIPDCIPELVGKVYADSQTKDDDHDEYCRVISDKKEKAKKYCIMANKLNNKRTDLSSLIDDNAGNNTEAEASVRDSDETIEVLLLCEGENGKLRFLPWRNGGAQIDTTCVPEEAESLAIARERLRLPAFFTAPYNWDKTVKQLRDIPTRWQDAPLLKGELMLILGKGLETELIGRRLRYSREYGLEEIKEDENEQRI